MSRFERVYVEEAAWDHPETRRILDRYRTAKITEISNYKEIFNRPRQEWRLQKRRQSLILARRRNTFLYQGSNYTPSFDHQRFAYNALALNCVFDCNYCYLQGMFPSAYLTLFVNQEDYLQATEKALSEGPLYLALSYDTDLLALETTLPYNRTWIDFTRRNPSLTVEMRTKSASFRTIRDIPPVDRYILAWTLSPQPVIDQYEPKTPSLGQRLKAISEAIQAGWKVRICIDPILRIPAWKSVYQHFCDQILRSIEPSGIRDVSLGVFRINRDYFKNLRKRATESDLLYYPYQKQGELFTYPKEQRDEMLSLIRQGLADLGVDRIV